MFVPAAPPDAKVIVVLVEQEGCGHCEEFHPIFMQQAAVAAAAGVPILRIDASTPNQQAQAFMNAWGVESTPTVLAVDRWGRSAKLEGVSDVGELQRLLGWAMEVHQFPA